MTDRILRLNPKQVTETHINNERKVRSNAGYIETQNFGGGFWRLQVEMPPLNRIRAGELVGFLEEHGSSIPFQLIISKLSNTAGQQRRQIVVNGALQTGSYIDAQAATAPNQTLLMAGDLIRFENQEKIYRVTRTVISDAIGQGRIYLSPNIITSPANLATVQYLDVPFRVICTGGIERDVNLYMRSSFSLTFEEAARI